VDHSGWISFLVIVAALLVLTLGWPALDLSPVPVSQLISDALLVVAVAYCIGVLVASIRPPHRPSRHA
jgi:hypothetical protein